MRRPIILILCAMLLAGLTLAGCGRPSPNQPGHIGQVHR